MTAIAGTIARPLTTYPVRNLLKAAARYFRNQRQYEDLEFLSDHLLADIGLTRSDVERAKCDNWLF